MGASEYTEKVDVWAVGCILAELLLRKVVFTGKDSLDQIKKIIQVLGTPSDADIDYLPKQAPGRRFLGKLAVFEKVPWVSMVPQISQECCNVLDAMLTWNYLRRPLTRHCVEYRFFEALHDPEDEPVAEVPMDWKFDNFTPTKPLLEQRFAIECSRFCTSALRSAPVLQEAT